MPCQSECRSSCDATVDRTADVRTDGDTSFAALVGDHPDVLGGLTDSGFVIPSPVQVVALPAIVAGNDTIVEAKNGTGKTLAFVVPTLMRLRHEHGHLQCVVLAPTREIAVQIQQCFKKVGRRLPKFKCEYFIGGTPVEEDKQKANGCQIAVGSPGRIKHLLNQHVLEGSNVKSFILDEVDRLFSDKNFINDIRLINAKFPKLKQMIAVSASIDKKDMSVFNEFMQEYTLVKGSDEDMNTSQDPSKFLIGIKQYVACVKAVSTNIILLPAKNVRLLNILQNLPYTQCIVFTNYMTRVEAVCNMLRDHNYKADYIRGDQDQNVRLKLVDRLTSFKSKILVATDLIARGIDSSNVDLVINMDCPNDWATYLHRIGRAGRYGNKGNVFTILDDDKELKSFKRIINSIENVKIKMLPIAIHKSIPEYADNELEDLNLTSESDVLSEPISENNIIEENAKECDQKVNSELKCNKSESKTISNSAIEPNPPDIEVKSIYGFGMTEEESLEKLRQVVRETEKKLIDNNLIDKKYLTEDRSFVLFDPQPYLDDTFKYDKYSTDELIEIMTKYDSDFDKYEAEKSLMSKSLVVQNDCENERSTCNQACVVENDCSEKLNDYDHIIKDMSDNNQPKESLQSSPENKFKEKPLTPRFTNVYDLFQIPDFGVLKPNIAYHDNDNDDICSNQSTSDSCSVIKEESNVSNDVYNSKQVENTESVQEGCDEKSNNYSEDQSWINSEESEGEIEWEEEEEEEENDNTDYESEGSADVVNSIYDECDNVRNYFPRHVDKPTGVYDECNDIQAPRTAYQVNGDQLRSSVDYDVLNDWYNLWKQQMGYIQTYVRLSK